MPDIKSKRTPMQERDPQKRIMDFEEVEVGYDDEMAKKEASRCLKCKFSPCISGCPVGINIPEFIQKILDGDIKAAYDIIAASSGLSAVCGRVCPQEKQCEAKCIRGRKGEPIAIGALERYVSDWHINNSKQISEKAPDNGIKIAVIGSGPSGLTCARELAIMGYSVTIYEALHNVGGVLAYGIPEFRLPSDILKREIYSLRSLGVKFITDTVIGKTFSINDLLKNGFRAIYISTGAGAPKFMGIPGEKFSGVFSANEFLTRINLMHAYLKDYDTPIVNPKRVAVIGGGNVAMDAARCARRLGSEVTVVYRRSEEEMPARKEEKRHAKEEGIKFLFLSNPVRIIGENGIATHIEYLKMRLSDPDESGRRSPVKVSDEKFLIEADCVIIAIGNSPNLLVKENTPELDVDNDGRILTDKSTVQTSLPKVYAGGDAVTGAATVILAMGTGKAAALKIHSDIISSGDA